MAGSVLTKDPGIVTPCILARSALLSLALKPPAPPAPSFFQGPFTLKAKRRDIVLRESRKRRASDGEPSRLRLLSESAQGSSHSLPPGRFQAGALRGPEGPRGQPGRSDWQQPTPVARGQNAPLLVCFISNSHYGRDGDAGCPHPAGGDRAIMRIAGYFRLMMRS